MVQPSETTPIAEPTSEGPYASATSVNPTTQTIVAERPCSTRATTRTAIVRPMQSKTVAPHRRRSPQRKGMRREGQRSAIQPAIAVRNSEQWIVKEVAD